MHQQLKLPLRQLRHFNVQPVFKVIFMQHLADYLLVTLCLFIGWNIILFIEKLKIEFIIYRVDFLITITFLGLGVSEGVGSGTCTGEETGARASTTGFSSSAGFLERTGESKTNFSVSIGTTVFASLSEMRSTKLFSYRNRGYQIQGQ